MREKQEQARREKENDLMYDLQTLKINKIRGQLENEFHGKKKNIEVNTKSLNLNNAINKKTQEEIDKQRRIEEERREIEEVLARGMKHTFCTQ